MNIRSNDIQSWIRGLQDILAPSTVRQVFVVFSAVLGAAVADGLLVSNPSRAASVRLPPVPSKKVHPWTADRVGALLDALPPRYRLAASLAAGCGLRQGECFGIRLEDIDFQRREVHVRQQVVLLESRPMISPPKYGRTRIVPAPAWVLEAAEGHLEHWKPLETGLLTYSREAKPVNKNYFNASVWRPALDAAGIPRGRENGMHALRHTCASLWLENGVSIKAVSEYLGHADPGFTLRVYTHVMPTSGDRARNAMDAAFGKGRSPANGAPIAGAPSAHESTTIVGQQRKASASDSG
ncbi:site-specific integrase [Aeromicrobium tamlense]|uniref:Integrase n=1 Tax=Aeromicrobium tamlense TaxID=375541 RepID=A0A8I0FW75_9ACTN|nr:site-specific integrase [Aeromicrobium tamlense]MBD1271727.1 site-specific integrase [Aeromicrobium tamlense]NYI37525.1 integrase [Aeromicrobium tamlense]